MDRSNQSATTNSAAADAKPLHCIVKLGGSAITCKNELETINEDNLSTVSSQLRKGMISGPCHGMDWSRRPGSMEIETIGDENDDKLESDCKRLIVVHGAGSYGHFQASKSGVHKGGLKKPLVKSGFVATRISVTTLNLEIIRALAKGMNWFIIPHIPRVGYAFLFLLKVFPLLGCHHFHVAGQLVKEMLIAVADTSTVVKALDAGFVPVLHGDAVLDTSLGCTILSGDVIIRHLAAHLRPVYVVFLTDVAGVFDRPPTERDAVLLREIGVHEDGSWSVLQPKLQEMSRQVEITVAAHDTTGGMVTKITEAAMIAKLGIDVYIVEAATEHSARALEGPLPEKIPGDWVGTVIRLAK